MALSAAVRPAPCAGQRREFCRPARRAVYIFARAGKFICQQAQQNGDQAVHDHSRRGLNRVFQLCRKLSGDGADGDAGDIIERVELSDLFVAHQLRQNKKDCNG